MTLFTLHKAKVFFLCVFAAVFYGILHDQITVRLCLEYFTVAHPPLFETTSPTLLAICWGFVATIGIGVILGIALAFLCEAGDQPPYPLPRLARSIARLLIVMGGCATLAGLTGYLLSRFQVVMIPADLAVDISQHLHHRFMAAWFAHSASYLVGGLGGVVLCFRVWSARGYPVKLTVLPLNRTAAIRVFLLAIVAAVAWWIRFGRSGAQ